MVSSRTAVDVLCTRDAAFATFAKDVLGASSTDDVWQALYGREWVSKISPDPAALAVPGRKLAGALKPKGIKPLKPKMPGMVKIPKAPMAPKAPTPKPAMAPMGPQKVAPKPKSFAPPKPPKPFGKAIFTPNEVPSAVPKRIKPGRVAAGTLVASGAIGGTLALKDKVATKFRGYKYVTKPPMEEAQKSWTGDFAIVKADDEKRQVFGWASVISKNGEPIIDKQGDEIDADELEKSAYRFVLESRKGGHQHRRTVDDQPMHVSDMIESMAFTPEKIEKMGLPPQTPVGWWVGFKVNDDDTWDGVKNGRFTSFSIHGRGRRVPVE